MQSPSVMFIEMAAAMLKDVPVFIQQSQRKELRSFGDTRAKAIGASGISDDFRVGYELGLQTARVLLMGNIKAVQAGVGL